jgi:hypothetical protein
LFRVQLKLNLLKLYRISCNGCIANEPSVPVQATVIPFPFQSPMITGIDDEMARAREMIACEAILETGSTNGLAHTTRLVCSVLLQ